MMVEAKDLQDFHALMLGGEPLKEAQLVYACPQGKHRLYIRAGGSDMTGFSAVALSASYQAAGAAGWGANPSEPMPVDVLFTAQVDRGTVSELHLNPLVVGPDTAKLARMLEHVGEIAQSLVREDSKEQRHHMERWAANGPRVDPNKKVTHFVSRQPYEVRPGQ